MSWNVLWVPGQANCLNESNFAAWEIGQAAELLCAEWNDRNEKNHIMMNRAQLSIVSFDMDVVF